MILSTRDERFAPTLTFSRQQNLALADSMDNYKKVVENMPCESQHKEFCKRKSSSSSKNRKVYTTKNCHHGEATHEGVSQGIYYEHWRLTRKRR